jgi:hypothetical protein
MQHQKQAQLVYKIGKAFDQREPEHSVLSIIIKAKEGPKDSITFFWYYDTKNATWKGRGLESSIDTYSLHDFTGKMRDANITKHCSPEEVIRFLEENKIKPAIYVEVTSAGQKGEKYLPITEDEIKSGKAIREGVIYSFLNKTSELLQGLEERQNIQPPKF